MPALIAEDLLLLLLDDEKGTLAVGEEARALLGGALVAELALAERVEVRERTNVWSAAKVVAVDGPPLADPLLDAALARVQEKSRSAQDLVNLLGKGVKEQLLERLHASGLVRPVKGTVLGLFPRTAGTCPRAS